MIRIFLFGATGDLSLRKLYPAFHALIEKGLLDKELEMICLSRRELKEEAFHAFLMEQIGGQDLGKSWFHFLNALKYHQLDFESPQDYLRLRDRITALEGDIHLFYLATAPRFFTPITKNLFIAGLLQQGLGNHRIVFEKPFGKDLESASEINAVLSEYVREDQIYRMDHYLGKEMIQNIYMLRFGNMIYEAGWNCQHIDHVQITVAESIGVLERAGYYDQSGAIRDMMQSHLLQMLALLAMTPKDKMGADEISLAKAEVLNALTISDVETDLVVGQYEAAQGRRGYREETGVQADSCTETYAAVKLQVDLPRWAGVDFYLRTGKSLAKKVSEIAIVYKETGRKLVPACPTNVLVIEIYPREGMRLKFNMKEPGATKEIVTREMAFCQSCLVDYSTPEAYEILIHEVVAGKHDLYTRWEEVKAAWTFVEKMLSACSDLAGRLQFYPAGSEGPQMADELLSRDGRAWQPIFEGGEDENL